MPSKVVRVLQPWRFFARRTIDSRSRSGGTTGLADAQTFSGRHLRPTAFGDHGLMLCDCFAWFLQLMVTRSEATSSAV
jgi:hypothetical protein